MGFYFVDPETYRKYRDEVLALSHAQQVDFQEHLPADTTHPALSDREIAERLGLEERLVREIRCVAERDKYPIDEWEEAIRFKERTCREYAKTGISSVLKKYRNRKE